MAVERPSSFEAEAVQVQAVAQAAAAYLSTRVFLEVVELWGRVGLGAGALARAGAFVAAAVKVVGLRRRQIAAVEVAALRLQRALRFGETIGLPSFGEPRASLLTVDSLRQDFRRTVRKYAPQALGQNLDLPALPRLSPKPVEADLSGVLGAPLELGWVEAEGPSDRPVDVFEDPSLVEELEALTGVFDTVTKEVFGKAAGAQLKRYEDAAESGNLDGVEARAGQVMGKAAWSASRLLADAVDRQSGRKDPKVRAWIRVHYSFDSNGPCSFCALMLSQGAVYKTKESAGGGLGSPFQFHPNCRCKAVPVYEGEQIESDPRFKANRFYRDLWDGRIKGPAGLNVRADWRRVIDMMNRGEWSPGGTP